MDAVSRLLYSALTWDEVGSSEMAKRARVDIIVDDYPFRRIFVSFFFFHIPPVMMMMMMMVLSDGLFGCRGGGAKRKGRAAAERAGRHEGGREGTGEEVDQHRQAQRKKRYFYSRACV